MPSDYESITKSNVARLGTDTESRRSQVCMYSDFTHFIYEILQNADDHEATSVTFSLSPDKLTIEYDARTPFATPHVEAISYFGKSTSRDDLIKAGRFGLGFKSVFALTATPEIHSGDEHFQIHDLYRLRVAHTPTDLDPRFTRLILPFDHEELLPDYVEKMTPKTVAFGRVSDRLRQLDMATLLFTLNVREVKWVIDDEKGHYVRQDSSVGGDSKVFGWRTTTITDGNRISRYLVFSRPVFWKENSSEKAERHRPVDIAFNMSADEGIVSAKLPLFVLFPTKIETYLGFIINGLYRTPPHRETVCEDDAYNRHLVTETASLLIDSLEQITRMGFMTVSVLNTLPIRRKEEYPIDWMLRPIADAIRNGLIHRALLPTYNGGFVAARHARLARGSELRRLLDQSQLQQLLSSEKAVCWLASEITENQTPDLWRYLTQELNTEVIDPETFARRLNSAFITSQDDKWVAEFYSCLSDLEALWRPVRYIGDRPGPLRDKEIIRLNDGSNVKPFRSDGQPNAFLPTGGLSGYSMIKASIAKNQRALGFLRRLGLREVGEREFIEGILSSYYVEDAPDPTQSEHIKHMKRFVAWHQKTGDKKVFDGCFLFQDNNMQYYHNAEECFLDAPLKDTGLSCLFESNPKTNPNLDRVSIWEGYRHIAGFNEFAASLGVMDELRIVPRSTFGNPETTRLHVDYYSARQTSTKIDEDYSIDSLDDLLSRKNVNISNLIWNTVRRADSKVLKARYRPNQQYNTRIADSALIYALRKHDWIPDRDGAFLLPGNVAEDMLTDGFIYDDRNGWLRAIGFGSNVEARIEAKAEKQKHAEALGIRYLESIEIIREIEANPDLFPMIRSVIDTARRPVAFPEHPSQDPGRRERRVADDIQNAPNKTYEKRERRTRISLPARQEKEIFLRESYTNPDSQMVCQICKEEMPFKKRDGNYYFEAVELISDLDREHEALFVALCPLCAAMFKEFVKRDADSMGALQRSIISSQQPEIPICLGQLKTTIRFVETHFLDLRTIVKELSGSS